MAVNLVTDGSLLKQAQALSAQLGQPPPFGVPCFVEILLVSLSTYLRVSRDARDARERSTGLAYHHDLGCRGRV